MSSPGARPREEAPLFHEGLLRPEEIQEILGAFFDQARASLEALGQGVLAIEGMVPSQARLRPLRRAAHTLKGDCASVGFGELSRLAHAVEDALAQLEQRGQRVSADESDRLLAAVDRLRSGVEAGAVREPLPGVDDLVEALTRGARAEGGAEDWEDGLGADDHRRLREGAAQGRHPFLLRVQPRGPRQDPRRAARSAARKLAIEVVAEVPARPGAGRSAALVGLSSGSEEELQVAARALRGVAIEVRRLRAAPAAGQSAAAASAREGETVRIEARRVDEVLNLVGEMVTARATLAGVAADAEAHLSDELAARLADAQSLLGHVLQDLQRSAMRMRMVAVDRVFRRFWRVVRDLGRHTGKRLVLAMEGEGTELDRGILDALDEPLLHLVRNAADHGIESPEARRAAGKPEEGRIVLRASREGNQILIEVADDGRGIDPAAVKQAAAAKGLLTEGEAALVDEDALQLVFRPGLSTARQVTETSGRGVGLEVVRETVEALKGSVRASNLPEGGASFLIKVPLTVAIIKALLFRVGGQDLAVPLTAVVEIARVGALHRERIGAHEVFRLRDAALGLVRLGPLLGLPDVPEGAGYVVVLQASSGTFGVLVEELMGEQELVIKAVHDRWIRTPLVAGASVLGRGALALILDVLSVHRAALGRGGSAHV
jgi:two-component system, chemotaxis family, sensor kinase CheA